MIKPFKPLVSLGVVSGALAGVAAFVYEKVYSSSLGIDFSNIAKPAAIIISCIVGCLVAAVGYWLMSKIFKDKTEPIFNLLFAVLSFLSILPAFAVKLPLDATSPELFPGMVIPMHFFPALAFFTIEPFFIKTKIADRKVVTE